VAATLSLLAVPGKADTFNLSPITIDTHTISGSTGYLFFSYGPDTTGSTPVKSTVTVSSPSFSTFSIDNTGTTNYELEPFTFGNTLTFTPAFVTTPTAGANAGNLFTLYALDSYYDPYPTSDSTNGNAAMMIVQYADGHVSSPLTYSPFVPIAPVPETSTAVAFAVLAFGSAFMLLLRRRQGGW
jgi:hypothetical protein